MRSASSSSRQSRAAERYRELKVEERQYRDRRTRGCVAEHMDEGLRDFSISRMRDLVWSEGNREIVKSRNRASRS